MSDKPAADEFSALMGDAQTHEPQEVAAAQALFQVERDRLAEDRLTVERRLNLRLMLSTPIRSAEDAFGRKVAIWEMDQARQRYEKLVETNLDKSSPLALAESGIGCLRQAARAVGVPEVVLVDYLNVLVDRRDELRRMLDEADRVLSEWYADDPNRPFDDEPPPEDSEMRAARRERHRQAFRRPRVQVTVWYVIRPHRMSSTGWVWRQGPFGSEAEAIARADHERERAAGRWPVEVVEEVDWEEVDEEGKANGEDAVAANPPPPGDLC
jgi:hypothetical protein